MGNLKIIDGHCDSLLLFSDKKYHFHKQNEIGHIDLQRLLRTNVQLQFFAVYVDTHLLPQALETGLTMSNQLLNAVDKDDRIFLVKNKEDLNRMGENKLGVLLSLEGGEVINKNIHLLEVFYKLGARALTLTWNHRNNICDGISEPSASGLTAFGEEVVKKMDELGMILDVSHISVKGFWDCIDLYSKPILASHSNAQKLCSHRRNLSDSQIKAIANSGGLVCVNYVPFHLHDKIETVNIDTIVDHISYISELVGIDFVGLGSDFDGVSSLPAGIKDVLDVPKIAERMKERGFSAQDIEKVFYNNFYNFLRKIL